MTVWKLLGIFIFLLSLSTVLVKNSLFLGYTNAGIESCSFVRRNYAFQSGYFTPTPGVLINTGALARCSEVRRGVSRFNGFPAPPAKDARFSGDGIDRRFRFS